MNSDRIYIYSGPKHSGKSSRLERWIATHENVAGILSPDLEGKRYLKNIASGELILMEAEGDEESVAVGKYVFSAAAFKKGNAWLREAFIHHHGWLVVDEAGPLELRGEGFATVLREIMEAENEELQLILVVREGLVEAVRDYFNITKFRNFDPENNII